MRKRKRRNKKKYKLFIRKNRKEKYENEFGLKEKDIKNYTVKKIPFILIFKIFVSVYFSDGLTFMKADYIK